MRKRRAAIAAAVLLTVLAAGAEATTSDPNAQIAYASEGRIHVVSADGSGGRAVANGGAPTWSPDGTMIAFHSARVPGYGLDVYVMGRAGRDQRRLVSHPTAGGESSDNTHDDFDPSWAPNGFFIAFATERHGNAEIYRMDTTGHATARLTNNPAEDREPAWSPDGRTIVFVSDRSGNDDVYVMRADSTGVRRLTSTAEPENGPAWSPDGRRLAFSSLRNGNADIYVIGADGSSEQRLTTDPAAELRPAWSADGRTLVFTRTDQSGRRLAVLGLPGGQTHVLTTAGELPDAASWRPGVDLALSVSAPQRVRRGQQGRARITVRNRFPVPAFNVALTIAVPRTARVVGARARGGLCSRERPVTCFMRTLTSSGRLSVELTLRPRRCGSLTLRGSVSSVQRDVQPGSNRRTARIAVAC